jgi:hypothetical protein
MKLIRRLPFLLIPLLVIVVVWCWWNWPRKVDMSQYAPADSLVYLECNDLPEVVRTLTTTATWSEFAGAFGLENVPLPGRWLSWLTSLGIGPAEAVVFSRSQVAIVMLNLEAAGQDSTLKIKPEAAIIVETHTSNWRFKKVAESRLMQFAEAVYGQTTPKRYREDADYIEWTGPTSERKIVAAIDQSLLVVGNSKDAVRSCLETHRGNRPSLHPDSALHKMRSQLAAAQGLSFGYVSAANAARLFSWAAPILFGREPGDSTLEQILSRRASKILGSIGWSAHPTSEGIEDRFFLELDSPVVDRLQPVFRLGSTDDSLWQVLPQETDSVTIYRSESPARAWQGLRAVSSQLDALSAVVLNSVLKASLLPYGIEDPDKFLAAVGHDVATVQLREGAGPVLFARIRDRQALEGMFKGHVISSTELERAFNVRQLEVSDKKFAVAFASDYFVMGPPAEVNICLAAGLTGKTFAAADNVDWLRQFKANSSSGIVTFVRDDERLRSFFETILSLQGRPVPTAALAANEKPKYLITETTLIDQGLERRTHSTLGQFSNLLSLLRRE